MILLSLLSYNFSFPVTITSYALLSVLLYSSIDFKIIYDLENPFPIEKKETHFSVFAVFAKWGEREDQEEDGKRGKQERGKGYCLQRGMGGGEGAKGEILFVGLREI